MGARGTWTLAAAAGLGLAACGRIGYDPVADDAPVAVRCAAADRRLTVTTDEDEDDAEALDGPAQGSGLSLREALALADATAGRECVAFAGEMAIALDRDLPAHADPAGVVIDGGGEVELVADGAPVSALALRGGGGAIGGLALRGFAVGLALEGAGHRVEGVTIVGGSVGIAIDGGDVAIVRALVRGVGVAIAARGTEGVSIRHATLHGNGVALDLRGASDATVANAILSGNQRALRGDGNTSLATFDPVDRWANERDCLGNCPDPGPGSLAVDPGYADAAAGDLTLGMDSPLIDAGADLGLDVNGDRPGDFDGDAPDLGAIESG